MNAITETRTLKIADKVIKAQDIRRLFNDLESEFIRLDQLTEKELDEELLKEKYSKYSDQEKQERKQLLKEYIYKRLKIKASDGSLYEGNSKDILSEGGILDTKRIESIQFDFIDNNHKTSISINIRHSKYDLYNEVSVQGVDSLWVNGIIQKIENFLETIETQLTWSRRYFLPISILFAICIGTVLNAILIQGLILWTKNTVPDPNSPKISMSTARIIFFGLMTGLSTYPALSLAEKLKELWPTVELQTGPDFGQIEKRKRKTVWLIFSLIILPAAMTIILDLLK